MSTDPHHCTCFRIDPQTISSCKSHLEKLGFKPQLLEESSGQIFGLTGRIDEMLQIHFKVMPNGQIESEMEPPLSYPGSHLNSDHSYSVHKETALILQKLQFLILLLEMYHLHVFYLL